jgi:hypothetical protein
MSTPIINVAIICGIAAATALAIAVVPAHWHEPPVKMVWPEQALIAPQPPATIASGNVAELLPIPEAPAKRVITEKYLAQSEKAKAEPPPLPLAEALKPRDVCARHGMRRIYFRRHHHLTWRCR